MSARAQLQLPSLLKERKKQDGPQFRRTPFDKLGANESGIAFVGFLPFVLNLPKHGFVNYKVVERFPESF